jgi:hypothetical protein
MWGREKERLTEQIGTMRSTLMERKEKKKRPKATSPDVAISKHATFMRRVTIIQELIWNIHVTNINDKNYARNVDMYFTVWMNMEESPSLVCGQASFKNKIIHLVKKIRFVEPKFITTFTLLCASLIQPITFLATGPIRGGSGDPSSRWTFPTNGRSHENDTSSPNEQRLKAYLRDCGPC